MRTSGVACLALLPLLVPGCGARLMAAPDEHPHYLRYVAFETPGHVHKLLRWEERQMPLAVYLPPPHAGFADEPEGLRALAREAVLAWSDAAGPGLPRFRFVDDPGEADIPVRWVERADRVSIAHCAYDVRPRLERLRIQNLTITGRYADGSPAPPDELRLVVIHEVGHALGLGGHSPNPGDVMYPFLHAPEPGGPGEDRPRGTAATGVSDRDRATLRALYAQPLGRVLTNARRVR